MRIRLRKRPALRCQGVRAVGSRHSLCAARWERGFEPQAPLQSPQPLSRSTMLWSATSRSENRRKAGAHFWRLKLRGIGARHRFARELLAKRASAPRATHGRQRCDQSSGGHPTKLARVGGGGSLRPFRSESLVHHGNFARARETLAGLSVPRDSSLVVYYPLSAVVVDNRIDRLGRSP